MNEAVYNLLQANPWLIPLLVAWSLPWKGWALWRAARLKYAAWFIILLVLNLLGIPEIIFILVTNKKYAELNGRIR